MTVQPFGKGIKMDILDKLFDKEDFQLPIVFKTDDYKSEIEDLLSRYIKELSNLYVRVDVIENVKKFRTSCSYTLCNYLRGIHSNAFENFEKAISYLGIDNSPLLNSELGEETLFRGRENNDDEDFDEAQMYHIPLNKRGIINTQRYSFPGLPCLYTGASVYTCWIEMNRPSFDKFQVASITPSKQAQKMKVYDLSNVPQRLNSLKQETWFSSDDYICYWPLMAVCSVKCNYENNAFKPEYIFPQFLLESIMKGKKREEYVGIKYASIKAASICNRQFEEDWRTYVNYVFPSRSATMIFMVIIILKEYQLTLIMKPTSVLNYQHNHLT